MILKDGYIHQQQPAQDPAYPAAREAHQRGTRTKQKQIATMILRRKWSFSSHDLGKYTNEIRS